MNVYLCDNCDEYYKADSDKVISNPQYPEEIMCDECFDRFVVKHSKDYMDVPEVYNAAYEKWKAVRFAFSPSMDSLGLLNSDFM